MGEDEAALSGTEDPPGRPVRQAKLAGGESPLPDVQAGTRKAATSQKRLGHPPFVKSDTTTRTPILRKFKVSIRPNPPSKISANLRKLFFDPGLLHGF
jgi:hypothetical protein